MKCLAWALIGAAALTACGDDGPLSGAEYGRQVFHDPLLSDSQFNAFSCATCHTTNPAPSGIQIGYSLFNSAFRESWWGGDALRLIDAVDFCFVYFMRGDALDPASDQGRALYEYLVSVSPERPSPALPMTIVENITTVPRGSSALGQTVYDAACRGCHGQPHTGQGRISELASVIPEDSIDFAERFDFDPALVVIEKVRHGQFFGVGGNMPLFTVEALTDQELGALIAYLGL